MHKSVTSGPDNLELRYEPRLVLPVGKTVDEAGAGFGCFLCTLYLSRIAEKRKIEVAPSSARKKYIRSLPLPQRHAGESLKPKNTFARLLPDDSEYR